MQDNFWPLYNKLLHLRHICCSVIVDVPALHFQHHFPSYDTAERMRIIVITSINSFIDLQYFGIFYSFPHLAIERMYFQHNVLPISLHHVILVIHSRLECIVL